MKIVKKVAYILVIIGALNWGLFGLMSVDLVEKLFGFIPMLARVVYVTVGLSALYILIERFASDSCDCNVHGCNNSKTPEPEKTPEQVSESSN